MDFDTVKENIQPLAQGRNASILQASINPESVQQLLAQRKLLERDIHSYSGDDPLSPWYAYIAWIEQSYPSGGKESGLQEVLAKCLARFESETRYFQDGRMIKLFIKYIDTVKNPTECYQQLFNAGIGTMVSDFYIAWAYCYSQADNFRKADEVFRRGIACRAQPLDELQEAHQHFNFAMAQRHIHNDNDDIREETKKQLLERRQALSSLRGNRRKQQVGSVRTGAAVKHEQPGILKADGPSTSRSTDNARVRVFNDENRSSNIASNQVEPTPSEPSKNSEEAPSVVRSIIDAHRDQENLKEPGPWNNPHKKGKLFSHTNAPEFSVHMDDMEMEEENENKCLLPIRITASEAAYGKPMKLPPNFCARNTPQSSWITPITTEDKPEQNTLPNYNKCKYYPRPNVELQPEEYKAYIHFCKRSIENRLTKRTQQYWGCGPKYNVRQYPNFCKKSLPQKPELCRFVVPPKQEGLQLPFDDIYDTEHQIERQYEEILALRIKRNETIIVPTDMEETICATSEKMQRRKSFFPMRKSMAPCAYSREVAPEVPTTSKNAESNALAGNLSNVEHKNPKVSSDMGYSIFQGHEEVSGPILFSKLQLNSEAETTKETAHSEGLTITTVRGPKLFEKSPTNSLAAQNKEPEVIVVPDDKTISMPANPTLHTLGNKFESQQNRDLPTVQEDSEIDASKSKLLPAPAECERPAINKIGFHIFEDELQENSINKNDAVPQSRKLFDADETCSTQTFNLFVRPQSVSTPNSKAEPKRNCGNVLRECVLPTTLEEKEDDAAPVMSADANDENCPGTVTYSPPRNRLSTILENSENAITQTTNSTEATTKSTISSPEFEPMPCNRLEMVKEESLSSGAASQVLDDLVLHRIHDSHNIEKSTKRNVSPTNFDNVSTGIHGFNNPGPSRMTQNLSKGSSYLLDSKEPSAGNFSRLEEKAETATGYHVEPVRFQDDKTETITRMHLHTQSTNKPNIHFTDDKTEPIPSVMLAPQSIQPVDDKLAHDPLYSSKMSNITAEEVKHAKAKTSNVKQNSIILQPEESFGDRAAFKEPFPLAHKGSSKFLNDKPDVRPQPCKEGCFDLDSSNTNELFELLGRSPPKSASDGKDFRPPSTTGRINSLQPKKDVVAVRQGCQNPVAPGGMNTNKISFNIFEDSVVNIDEKKKVEGASKTYFGGDETCSTQTFNLFLRAQSVSTPNAKPDSAKYAGSLLKDARGTNTHPGSAQKLQFDRICHDEAKVVEFSSKPKQLSTIMESSANASHGLGAVAKQLSYGLKSHTTTATEVLSERALPSDGHDKAINSSTSLIKITQKTIETEDVLEAVPHVKNDISYSLSSKVAKKADATANLTGFEDKHDNNAAGYVFGPSKYTSASQQVLKFQDDKTETMSVVFTQQQPLKFQDDKTETISKILTVPAQAIQMDKSLNKLAETELQKPQSSFSFMGNNVGDISGLKKPDIPSAAENPKEEGLKKKPEVLETSDSDELFELFSRSPPRLSNIAARDPMSLSKPLNLRPSITADLESTRAFLQKNQPGLDATNTDDLFELFSRSPPKPNRSVHNPVGNGEKQQEKKQKCDDLFNPSINLTNLTLSKLSTSIDVSKSELSAIRAQKAVGSSQRDNHEANDFGDMSIYYKSTPPRTPEAKLHVWDLEEGTHVSPDKNNYTHIEHDMNQTQEVLLQVRLDPNVNPFSSDLIQAFLNQINFTNYIENLPECELVGVIHRLKAKSKIKVNGVEMEVLKLVGEGSYGAVFLGKEIVSGRPVALKQEKPPNYWEYYICLEIRCRIQNDAMLTAFMSIDYALIGNNSSVFASQFSHYGSLIAVCNKIKKQTGKDIDEYVVMLLACDLLQIVDHLHAINIIHADIKADNFLLMQKLSYPPTNPAIQLIDFGVSIDMQLFNPNQTFSYVNSENAFKCVEMREGRPWTYQLDLFGLAGVLHVLLFGAHMDIVKKPNGFWMPKSYFPRYFKKSLWETIFRDLLNIRDCNNMPNLQSLRVLLKEEIEEREKYVANMVTLFNNALDK